jgi:hypothetical protein
MQLSIRGGIGSLAIDSEVDSCLDGRAEASGVVELGSLEAILQDIIKHSPEGREIASKWLLGEKVEAKYNPLEAISRPSGLCLMISCRIASRR